MQTFGVHVHCSMCCHMHLKACLDNSAFCFVKLNYAFSSLSRFVELEHIWCLPMLHCLLIYFVHMPVIERNIFTLDFLPSIVMILVHYTHACPVIIHNTCWKFSARVDFHVASAIHVARVDFLYLGSFILVYTHIYIHVHIYICVCVCVFAVTPLFFCLVH